jgi:hypothetical protein
MYAEVKTWNPFVGCLYGCIYCKVSFQQQLKRWGKRHCENCYHYRPHMHLERLEKIPSAKKIFVCGDGDITFAPNWFLKTIISKIREHNKKCPYKTYYFQTKNPAHLKPFLELLPENAIIITTLETNRDNGYEKISKAPFPSKRFSDFLQLNYPRKVITIEPIMNFDIEIFTDWIRQIKPEYVYIGFNSRPNRVTLSEPTLNKVQHFINELKKFTDVKGKELRGLKI